MAIQWTRQKVAKYIKRLLSTRFPGTKFSVRSRSYANGSSVEVDWTGGPEKQEVYDLVGHICGLRYDPLTEISELSLLYYNVETNLIRELQPGDAYSDNERRIYPGNSHISITRHVSP